MSYGWHRVFRIGIVLVFVFSLVVQGYTTCFTRSDSSAELSLGPSDVVIHEDLLKLCPGNTSHLYVSGSNVTGYRVLSFGFLRNSVLPGLERLQIDVGHLKISQKDFRNNISSNLKFLSLSNCSLESLPAFGMLHGLESLKIVDLSHNKLRWLPVDIFHYSKDLQYLNLSHNFLSTLPNVPYPFKVFVSNNPISCSCVNARLLSKGFFDGVPVCKRWPQPCKPTLDTYLYVDSRQQLSFVCNVNSDLPYVLFWVSPVGIISPPNTESEVNAFSLSYVVQPILAATVFNIVRVTEATNALNVENTRGHLSGKWSCVAYSSEATSQSSSVELRVVSSLYNAQIYYISLCYGYGGMILLLLVGIIGGTIRYCSETHCLRRPQPSCAFKGKTYVGVIPVPEMSDEEGSLKHHNPDKVLEIPLGNSPLLNKYSSYFGPNSRWNCASCKTVHFVEKIQEVEDAGLLIAAGDVPLGRIAPDGEIIIIDTGDPDMETDASNGSLQPISEQYKHESIETHQPLMCGSVTNSDTLDVLLKSTAQQVCKYDVCVRSGRCVVRVRLNINYSASFRCPSYFASFDNSTCAPCLPRPGSADVKLVVSNEKLAQEYRDALASLAQAVENPDPAHFREKLDDFRSRLCRDVGHGVKVLRGEFQDLRAKSAKSVASLRTQSSAAAQRMRAGLFYGVEQMKDGMRSVAELCGASGTIGQTISVVSVYVDEKDQTKKEKHISDFVF
ncbi:unnamed protein product [Heterobilharzia americana]|nr:unnamed protein product [Heterobilharzia americana]